MRATFFCETPHRIAGAQKSLLTAVVKGRAFGLEPTMVFPAEGLFAERCRAEGLDVEVLEGPPAFTSFGKALLRKSLAGQLDVIVRQTLPYAQKLARELDRTGAEVVHFNTARGVLLASWGAHLSGRNTVMHQRGSVAIGRLPWLAAQALSDRLLLVARALMPEVAPSMRPRATVLYNGVNVGLPRVDRKEARRAIAEKISLSAINEEGAPLFVSMSSPTPFKGLHYLVEAAAIAKKKGVRAAYVLAGEPKPGGYQAWLSRRIEALGLSDSVALVGFVADTHGLLCAADALILPSVEEERIEADGEVFADRSNEGLPRSILEAMAAGIPSIASDIAGVKEQIEDGHNGLLVRPKDAEDLASAIQRLAQDEAYRRHLGAAAHETARARFRVEDAAKGLVTALTEVAAEPASLARKMARWPALARDGLTPERW